VRATVRGTLFSAQIMPQPLLPAHPFPTAHSFWSECISLTQGLQPGTCRFLIAFVVGNRKKNLKRKSHFEPFWRVLKSVWVRKLLKSRMRFTSYFSSTSMLEGFNFNILLFHLLKGNHATWSHSLDTWQILFFRKLIKFYWCLLGLGLKMIYFKWTTQFYLKSIFRLKPKLLTVG